MGWKAGCIIASQRPAPWLPSIPRQDPGFARRIAAALPLGPMRSVELKSFEEGIYSQRLMIGAYDRSLIIGHDELSLSCLSGETPPVVHAIDALLPRATSLVLGLHSVVNFYGYALFEGTKLVRVRAGSADDGVIVDKGEWLPEEQPLFARSEIRDGERIFFQEIDGRLEEFDHASFGEEFVFGLSARCFGQPMDRMESWEYPMEVFEPTGKPFWKRFLGR